MAVTALTPQVASDAGITPTYGALNATDTFTVKNGKPFLLHFKKSGAGICNVTFASPVRSGIRGAVSKVVAIPATTGDKMVGPFDPNTYDDAALVKFSCSEATGLTCAVVQLPLTHRARR